MDNELKVVAEKLGYEVVGAGALGLCLLNRMGAWNPKENSGDSFDLAMDMRLSIELGFKEVIVTTPDGDYIKERHEHDDDLRAVTRRAIFRAALKHSLEGNGHAA